MPAARIARIGQPDVFAAVPGLTALFSELPDAVLVGDAGQRIVWANHAAEACLALPAGELIGRETATFYHDRRPCDARVRHRRDDRDRGRSERVTCRRANGEPFLADSTSATIRSPGGRVTGHLAIIRDVTREVILHSTLDQLCAISSDQAADSGEKIGRILDLACRVYDLPTAIVGFIHGDRYVVVYARSRAIALPTGTEIALGETYCADTLLTGGPLAFHHAGEELAGHPCFEKFRLRSYIGIPLVVDGERFGTLSLSGGAPRAPFASTDVELMRLFSAWIAQELSRAKAMDVIIREAGAIPPCMRTAWRLA